MEHHSFLFQAVLTLLIYGVMHWFFLSPIPDENASTQTETGDNSPHDQAIAPTLPQASIADKGAIAPTSATQISNQTSPGILQVPAITTLPCQSVSRDGIENNPTTAVPIADSPWQFPVETALSIAETCQRSTTLAIAEDNVPYKKRGKSKRKLQPVPCQLPSRRGAGHITTG